MEAIETLADPDQDNCTFSVIKLNHNKPVIRAIRAKPVGHVDTHTSTVTRVVDMDDAAKVAAKAAEKVQPAPEPANKVKEVRPVRQVTVNPRKPKDAAKEVDDETPPAKLAAGGK